MNRCLVVGLFCLCVLTACNSQRGQTLEDLPTPAAMDSLATAQFLTSVAPPVGFRESVSFSEIDLNLNQLAGGRYRVELLFDGVFASTPRQTNANAVADVWFNQIGSSRRVIVATRGEMLGREDNAFEAVRLGPDSFLVQSGVCVTEVEDAETAAALRAGTLVGGASLAFPAGQRAIVNGQDVWRYTFEQSSLNLPAIRVLDGGRVELVGGELWVNPAENVVTRFYVSLNVVNTIIFDRALPVDGLVTLRYDLYDVNVTTNLSIPNGC